MARDFRAPGTLRCIGTYFLLFCSTAFLDWFRFIVLFDCVFGLVIRNVAKWLEYLAELKKECIGKAETYEERKGYFEAELAGLRQALKILGGESASFIQKRSLRAVRHHSM